MTMTDSTPRHIEVTVTLTVLIAVEPDADETRILDTALPLLVERLRAKQLDNNFFDWSYEDASFPPLDEREVDDDSGFRRSPQ